MTILMIRISFIIFILYPLIFAGKIQAQQSSYYESRLDSAKVYLSNNTLGEALILLSPLTELEKLPEIKVKALRLSGSAYISSRNYEEAAKLLNKSLVLSKKLFNRYEQTYSLYLLGRIDSFSGRFEQAKEKAQEGIYLARILNKDDLEYNLNNLISWSYFATGETFYKVLEHEARQFRLVNKFKDKRRKALVYNNLGYDLTVAGTVSVDSTISLMKFANDTYAEMEGHEGRWYTLINLTWQHRLKHDLENAVKYGEKSLNQALVEEDRHAIVEAVFQLGESLMEMGEMKKAKNQYEIGLEWRGEEEDRDRYVFDVYYARYLWESGERQQAISLLKTGVEWLTQSEVFYEMHGRALLASYYWELGQTDSAVEQLEILENPRGDYISLETRCLGAITRAKWFVENDQSHMTKALMESWLTHTKEIGAELLSRKIKLTLSEL